MWKTFRLELMSLLPAGEFLLWMLLLQKETCDTEDKQTHKLGQALDRSCIPVLSFCTELGLTQGRDPHIQVTAVTLSCVFYSACGAAPGNSEGRKPPEVEIPESLKN